MKNNLPLLALVLSLPVLSLTATPLRAQDSLQAINLAATSAEAQTLGADPAWIIGQLDNGMRYMIRQNATPPGTALVRMEVSAARFDERDNERGLAHFVEHMAFNGSTNVPEGEMVKLLERLGLAFGADTNAETGFLHTQYKLDLPKNDPKLLDTALMLMRETASELTFDPEAVERERGIMAAEERTRNSFARRNSHDQLAFLFPGTMLDTRFPRGDASDAQTADAETIEAYWQRNYVPEKTTLIVVGDFDPVDVERNIRARFDDWATDIEAFEQPKLGLVDLDRTDRTDIYLDPALPETLQISQYGPYAEQPDTAALRRERNLRDIGLSIVNRRLQRLARSETPPFRGAGFGVETVFDTVRGTNLVVNTVEGGWRTGLNAAVEEYVRAMTFGFTDVEVAEQVANKRTALENGVAMADTRSNGAFINQALGLIRDDIIPTTPQSSLERFDNYKAEITPETVYAAMRAFAVELDDPLIRFSGKTAPENGEAALRKAWDTAMARKPARAETVAAAIFAYTDFGPAGQVVADETLPGLGIRKIRFGNGVMLNLKRTDLQKDRVTVRMSLDGGDMLKTGDNPLAVEIASLLPQGGLGKHSNDELQTILAGRTVGGSFTSAGDTFHMGAGTTPRDLPLQLQLMTAYLTDPGYREDAITRFRNVLDDFFARRDATPIAALRSERDAIIADNDPRFTTQSIEQYRALDFDDLREAIGGRLAGGAIELAIVGDFDEQAAIDAVASTLGALPARETVFKLYPDNRERGFTTDRSIRTLTHSGPADQGLAFRAWPTTDDTDVRGELVLDLLARIAQLDVTAKLREELGTTYSPSVGSSQSSIYPGFGTFAIAAQVEPVAISATQDAIDEVVTSLRTALVDDDRLQRARQPLVELYDNYLDSNGGWLALASRAQSHPERVGRYAEAKALLPEITANDLQDAALLYLDPANGLPINVIPKSLEISKK